MLRRLRLKFICINMVTVTAMLCVILGLVYHFTRMNLERESLRLMQTAVERPFQPGPPGQLPEQLPLPCYFILRSGRDGMDIVAQSGYDLTDQALLESCLEAALASGAPAGVLEDYGLRFCRAARPGEVRFIFAGISSERTTLKNLLGTSLLVGAVSFIAFLGISLLLARWAVGPVERAWAQQKQFVADASHELKTPLTVIMTNAELLQSGAPEQVPRASRSILAMSRQMRGLVEGLLELARADAGTARDALVPLDFSKLVSDALLPFEPILFEAGLDFTSRVEPGIRLTGNPGQLRQVIHILLDNARKYTSPNGQVTVDLRRRGRGRCVLSAATSGQPLTSQERTDIFKASTAPTPPGPWTRATDWCSLSPRPSSWPTRAASGRRAAGRSTRFLWNCPCEPSFFFCVQKKKEAKKKKLCPRNFVSLMWILLSALSCKI